VQFFILSFVHFVKKSNKQSSFYTFYTRLFLVHVRFFLVRVLHPKKQSDIFCKARHTTSFFAKIIAQKSPI
ncbi:MAG: hypothetical protein IKY53_00100, partial [Lachnospiraceae bacterium]|nr:hypothetical protein [Lachnospiraceae bacterium]